MGVINEGASTFISGVLDTYIEEKNSPQTGRTNVDARTINGILKAVTDIETIIGVGAAGSMESIAERLDASLSASGGIGAFRQTQSFDGLREALYNNTSSPAAGWVQGEPGHTETLDIYEDTDEIHLASGTKIVLPRDYKVSRTKSGGSTSNECHTIVIDGVTDIEIDGGEWDMNAANNGYYSENDCQIIIKNSSRIKIKNCYFHHPAGDNIFIGTDVEDVTIQNCTFNTPAVSGTPLIGRNSITIGPVEGGTAKQIRIVNCTFLGAGYAHIDIEPWNLTNLEADAGHVEDVIIANNYFEASGRGVAMSASMDYTSVKRIKIHNNIFVDLTLAVHAISTEECTVIGNSMQGCDYGVWGPTNENLKIFGNDIYEGTIGISLQQGNHFVEIENNSIHHNSNDAIVIAGVAGTLNEWIIISRNKIYDNDCDHGIYAYLCENLIIDGNFVVDTQDTPTQGYGIWFEQTTTAVCTNNIVQGNENNEIYDAANTGVTKFNNLISGELSVPTTFTLPSVDGTNFVFQTGEYASGVPDMIQILNRRTTATKIGVLMNQPQIFFYDSVTDNYAVVGMHHPLVAQGAIQTASTPANFSADKCLQVDDHLGNTYYIPVKAATW